MRRAKSTKPYWKMTAEELAEATKEFDRPIPASRLKPLTKAQRLWWERTRRQPSRSVYIVDRSGGGRDVVLVRLDTELLRRSHECARRHDMTWEQLVERGLRSALAVLEVPKPNTTRKSA